MQFLCQKQKLNKTAGYFYGVGFKCAKIAHCAESAREFKLVEGKILFI